MTNRHLDAAAKAVHVIIDLSNITIGLKDSAAAYERSYTASASARLDVPQLYRLSHADRPVNSMLIVGSDRPLSRSLAVKFRTIALNIDVALLEPGRQTGREQGVDEVAAARMFRLVDEQPATLVLLTGDGAGHLQGDGFLAGARRLARLGWGIEILAWRASANARLVRWAETEPAAEFIALDDYYEAVTFLEDWQRRSHRIDLRDRRVARPQISRQADPGQPLALIEPPDLFAGLRASC